MFQWIKRQLDEMGSPTLDWVQVEVTTDCNAACVYCPHTIMKNRWTTKHMPLDLFYEFTPFLKYTDLVYLQGWGEPLLNNDLFEMVRICKDQGKRVGFTTNGMLLSEDTMRRLVGLDLDILGVSLAGATSKTHHRFRKGTDFNKVISSLERLCKIKAGQRTRLPAVHLAYLMLRSNFHELQEIVPLAKRLGAEQIVASNLTLIMDPNLSAEAIFNDAGLVDHCRIALEEIKDRAARENIVFDYHGPGLDEACVGCRENLCHACVINVEGEVAPCVFTNSVLCENDELGEGPCYAFKDQSLPLRERSFGNIRNETLTQIWNKKEYARFRDLFDPQIARKPEQILSEMPECCAKCHKRLGA
jgi:MoaA/NifB/PqqE/SkfB family radical SAM enzyme